MTMKAWDEIWEHKAPWWRRYFYSPLLRFWDEWSPRMLYRKTRWFIQRGRRGWADRDIWSLDSYLAGWMPDALRRLKATKHGIPMSMFPEGDMDTDAAEVRWNAILDKMILGFEAYTRFSEGDYPELGPIPRRDYGAKQQWLSELEKLSKRDQDVWDEGAVLFTRHLGSLWD